MRISVFLRAISLAGACFSISAHADEVQVLVFPDFVLESRRSATTKNVFEPAIGLFATGTKGKFVWLTEAFVSRDEREIERAQIGWRLGTRDTLWVGRLHTPIGYWNTEYHHGTYLHTSHSRPAIDDFEDEGSPVPKHFVGLLWEGSAANVGGGALRYSAAWGAQPRWNDGALAPQNILQPRKFGRHANGGTVRLAYRPDEVNTDEYGISFHIGTALGDAAPVAKIVQSVIAAHVVKTLGPTKWTATLTRVQSEFFELTRKKGSFLSLWGQGEYTFNGQFTGYARAETASNGATDPLLTLMPDFARRKNIVGLRWDYYRQQALRIEYEQKNHPGSRLREIGLTWSAVFP